MAAEQYHLNDLVWAKMKGYPPWPAQITEPNPDSKPPKNKKAHFVFFFGSNNFAWILDENIKPHSQTLLNNLCKKKSVAYKAAIEAFINFINDDQEDDKDSSREEMYGNIKEREGDKLDSSTEEMSGNDLSQANISTGNGQKKMLTSKAKKKINKGLDVEEDSSNESGLYPESSMDSSGEDMLRNEDDLLETDDDMEILTDKAKRKIVRKRSDSEDYDGIEKRLPWVKRMRLASGSSSSNDFDGSSSSSADSDGSYPSHCPSRSPLISDFHIKSKHGHDNLLTTKKLGFIGLGNIGNNIVRNLLRSNLKVMVWNKTDCKCDDLISHGATKAESPSDLVIACDIIFCCLSDADALKSVISGEFGILNGFEEALQLGLRNKGYIEMTLIGPETSQEIFESIVKKGVKYLEAPICGTTEDAVAGSLQILAAGNRDLFVECENYFRAMAKKAVFLSYEVGYGNKMSLLQSAVLSTIYVSLAEVVGMADAMNIDHQDFKKIFCEGPFKFQDLTQKMEKMIKCDFKSITPLKYVQKNLNLALRMGDQFSQSMRVTAAANEQYKHSEILHHSDYDVAAVILGLRC